MAEDSGCLLDGAVSEAPLLLLHLRRSQAPLQALPLTRLRQHPRMVRYSEDNNLGCTTLSNFQNQGPEHRQRVGSYLFGIQSDLPPPTRTLSKGPRPQQSKRLPPCPALLSWRPRVNRGNGQHPQSQALPSLQRLPET